MATTYRPAALTFNSGTAGRGAKSYDAADVPVPSYMVSPGVDRTVLQQQFAYEWYDYSGRYSMGSNPPFTKGSAGRLLPDFTNDGQPRRILRGFIRRSDYDMADTKSGARLYFMYNPETITRDYVSYLDQGALDPFNTVFQAGNLVAPPSFMDFDFSLLFDRQEEASQDGAHPGVFVDYEYFDLVVRNVVPSYDPNSSSLGGSELPDNGVMMVNPRDITVVFSPNITVQGRPKNARVSFTKFTHRMIPIRMQIDLTIRVTYFGPMKDMVEYKQEQATVTDTVPWNVNTESPFTITYDEIKATATAFSEKMVEGYMLTKGEVDEKLAGLTANGTIPAGAEGLLNTTAAASGDLNASIADWANKQITANPTKYCGDNAPSGTTRANLWAWGDCSSWIWAVFATHPSKPNTKMGPTWNSTFESKSNIPATGGQMDSMRNQSCPNKEMFYSRDKSASVRSKIIAPQLPLLLPGDLLFRRAGVVAGHDKGHVAMVYGNDTVNQKITYVHNGGGRPKPSSQNSMSYGDIASSYTECYRPLLGNPNMVGNSSADPLIVDSVL
jgi:hypothetical protein